MSNTWITDIRHFLGVDGTLVDPKSRAGKLGRYFCSIVELATGRVGSVRCRRRPGRIRCMGNILALIDTSESGTITWICPFCEDDGYITGWEGTVWDKRLRNK